MTRLGKFKKQPVEVLDYEFDFSLWLADRADTIQDVTVTAAPLGSSSATSLTISNVSHAAGVVRFYVAGGSDGIKYEVTCTITTAASPPRVKQDELVINVREE